MNGYSSHTLKLVNRSGEEFYTKWHFKTDQGNRTLTAERATHLAGTDADYATRDLSQAIQAGQFPTWTVHLQVSL
jgi:catalase